MIDWEQLSTELLAKAKILTRALASSWSRSTS